MEGLALAPMAEVALDEGGEARNNILAVRFGEAGEEFETAGLTLSLSLSPYRKEANGLAEDLEETVKALLEANGFAPPEYRLDCELTFSNMDEARRWEPDEEG